jgi:hypothetical protein
VNFDAFIAFRSLLPAEGNTRKTLIQNEGVFGERITHWDADGLGSPAYRFPMRGPGRLSRLSTGQILARINLTMDGPVSGVEAPYAGNKTSPHSSNPS